MAPHRPTDNALQQQINAALVQAKEPLNRNEVAEIVQQVMNSFEGDLTQTDIKFVREIQALASYIRNAKAEISAIRPKEIKTEHIPDATDQLDAVVGATEEATNKIMDECDKISAIAGECSPEVNERIIACVTRVFEACNFQDLTGQRITKVVATLKHIDEKVEALLRALGEDVAAGGSAAAEVKPEKPKDPKDESHLLNGPQLPGAGVSQADIDALFG